MIGAPRNEMLIVYLGGDRSPGVLLYGEEGRVQAVFGERLSEVLSICHEIVEALECSPETLSVYPGYSNLSTILATH